MVFGRTSRGYLTPRSPPPSAAASAATALHLTSASLAKHFIIGSAASPCSCASPTSSSSADSRVARRLASPRSFAFEGEASETAFEGAGYGTTPTGVSPAVGAHNPTGGNDDMDVARVLDPYGLIGDVMSSPAQTLTPELELDDPVVRQSLERYHGLPVVSAETGAAVGVLSRSDVRRLGDENTEAYTVGEAMSSPPVCVRPRAQTRLRKYADDAASDAWAARSSAEPFSCMVSRAT